MTNSVRLFTSDVISMCGLRRSVIAAKNEPDGRRSDFPKHAIEAVLPIAQVIEDKNAGNPLPPLDVALALGIGPGSSKFRDLLSSSIKYGLTSGSFNQPKVSLEMLGRAIVSPKSADERRSALLRAVMQPEPFRRVYDYYKGKKLPEPQFLANTLVREFSVPKDTVNSFVEVFNANVAHLGLVKDGATGKWLSSELPAEDSVPSLESWDAVDLFTAYPALKRRAIVKCPDGHFVFLDREMSVPMWCNSRPRPILRP